jgi:hypothetical protein
VVIVPAAPLVGPWLPESPQALVEQRATVEANMARRRMN